MPIAWSSQKLFSPANLKLFTLSCLAFPEETPAEASLSLLHSVIFPCDPV